MKLKIRRELGQDRDVKLIREAVPFMLGRLLKPEQLDQVSLHITITHLDGDFGDIGLEHAPYFRLRLHHDMNALLMIVTLAHELVHLAQVMDGRLNLKEINGLLVWYWGDRPYGSEPYAEVDKRLPWETDAERREGALACHFVKNYVSNLNHT